MKVRTQLVSDVPPMLTIPLVSFPEFVTPVHDCVGVPLAELAILPLTSKAAAGAVVPIPTLPVLSMIILLVGDEVVPVENTKSPEALPEKIFAVVFRVPEL